MDDTLTKKINMYNQFCDDTLVYPEDIKINVKFEQTRIALEIPEILMKYQDTDSSYITMKVLDWIEIKPEFSGPEPSGVNDVSAA